MFGRADVRVIRRGAGIAEGAELGIDGDKGIDARFNLRLQLLIGDLADDAVSHIAPGESGGSNETYAKERRQENQCLHEDRLETRYGAIRGTA